MPLHVLKGLDTCRLFMVENFILVKSEVVGWKIKQVGPTRVETLDTCEELMALLGSPALTKLDSIKMGPHVSKHWTCVG